MIIFDSNFQDIGPTDCEFDIEVGTYQGASNDFQLLTMDPLVIAARGCYIEGTEYGGLIEEIGQETESPMSTLSGETWRGLLKKEVVRPTSGLVRTVSGDGNAILRGLVSNVLGGIFEVPETTSGVTVESYDMAAYQPILQELDGLLSFAGAKLVLTAVKEDGRVRIISELKPAAVVEGEFNSDNNIPMTFNDNRRGFNHCICVGGNSGQTVVHLYADASGRISTTQTFTGIAERTTVYINNTTTSADQLRKEGTKAFQEELSYKTLSIDDAQAQDLGDIGDIITGSKDSLIVRSPIERKLITNKDGRQTISCNVKGGD
jgi:hypothetical protein